MAHHAIFSPPCLERISSDIPGAEGPLVTRDGRIFLVEPGAGAIFEIDLQRGAKTFLARTGGTPSGLQLHSDGSIWVADMKLGILRVSLDGCVEPIVTTFDGRRIRGCNDCSFDSQGNLYFSAPADSNADVPCGEFFCRLADGFVHRLDHGFRFCNGVAVASDDRLVVVAETYTRRLYGYRLTAPGQVGEKYVFGTLPGDHTGGPDGIEFDVNGCLIATNWGGGHLEIFSPAGRLIRRAQLPFDHPSNLHFSGPGSTTLLITEHTNNALWRCEWPSSGQIQYGWREHL